jgi:hypothetical protein
MARAIEMEKERLDFLDTQVYEKLIAEKIKKEKKL